MSQYPVVFKPQRLAEHGLERTDSLQIPYTHTHPPLAMILTSWYSNDTQRCEILFLAATNRFQIPWKTQDPVAHLHGIGGQPGQPLDGQDVCPRKCFQCVVQDWPPRFESIPTCDAWRRWRLYAPHSHLKASGSAAVLTAGAPAELV